MIVLKDGNVYPADLRLNAIVMVPVLLIFFIFLLVLKAKKHNFNFFRILAEVPLFAYLYVLIAVTLFPIQIFTKNTSVYSDGFGKQSMLLNLNALYIQNYSLLQIVGNLLLLAPLAFFLALFFAKLRGLGRNLLVCALVSLAIETLQLIMNFFYLSYRTFDITDFILNSIGSLLGLAAFEIVYIIFRESVDKVTPS